MTKVHSVTRERVHCSRTRLPKSPAWIGVGLLCALYLGGSSALAQSTPPSERSERSGPNFAGFAPIGGAMMYYEVHGTGEPILFIHGGGGSSKLWGGPGGYIEQLSKDFMVIVADSRGQGQSTEGEGPITYGRVGYDALALLDYLGIKRAHFVGHSSGSVGLLHILIDFPERVITATLSGTIYNVANYRPEAYQEMKRSLEAQLAGTEASSFPLSVVRKFHNSWLTQPTLSLAELDQIPTQSLDTPEELEQQGIAEQQIARPVFPILVVKEDRDQFIETRVFDEIHEHIKGSTLLYCPGDTHRVIIQCRDRIIPAIRELIARSHSSPDVEVKSQTQ